jgi:hypothetical protein
MTIPVNVDRGGATPRLLAYPSKSGPWFARALRVIRPLNVLSVYQLRNPTVAGVWDVDVPGRIDGHLLRAIKAGKR